MIAGNTELPALPLAERAEPAAAPSPTAPARAPRGKLFRKYVLFFVGLVAVALLVNGGFDFWFGYQENKAALIRVQQEKADAAAQRIEEFVDEIERQIGWTTHAQWSAAPLDQRRFDYVRLLSQVPAITEISELDHDGKEQLKVSRLAMDVVGSGADLSQTPAFTEARAHKVWFSPVYFRKESEPYMTLAIARAGRNAGVTVAEVNLKLIWDVITGLRIGQGGYAYVVDSSGKLIAHPDISLVLRDTDFLHLPQVAAALPAAQAAGAAPAASVAPNSSGNTVLSAHAAIAPLGWLVFVEVPLREAFAPLYGAALRSLALLAFGLIGATLVALLLARRMTGPIRAMQEGAARIGAGDLDRRLDIHTGDELEALAEQFNRMAADLRTSYAELEHKVEERTAELSESLEYQTATSDVLKVISRSTFDLQPVLDTLVETAARLCKAEKAILYRYQDDAYRYAAGFSNEPDYERIERETPIYPGEGTVAGRAAMHKRAVRIDDALADPLYTAKTEAEIGRARAMIGVPLLREGLPTGVIALARERVEPFSDKEIELVATFADQAVIAIENARLITETQEALDRQTATAEVLEVINSSPGDLAPVFDAMLEKAMRLCEASIGAFYSFDGESLDKVAHRGNISAEHIMQTQHVRVEPGGNFFRLIQGETIVHVADLKETEMYRSGFRRAVDMVDIAGARTAVWVGLRRDETLLGILVIYRQEVRPFTDKQIALLQNFAAQAVIAMENARLITETREALNQQTATAEVLEVINSSPGDLAPVFDAMLEKAVRLLKADFGILWRFEDGLMRLGASYNVADAFIEHHREPMRPGPESGPGRMMRGGSGFITGSFLEFPPYLAGDPAVRSIVELAGARSAVIAPLRKDGAALGSITIYRKEVQPFSEKQLAVLENFAAQAVIAMENTRLITETREALEQQTATAEVLQVINSSPGDLVPVFEAMIDKAMRLCEAAFGALFTYDGAFFRVTAHRNIPDALMQAVNVPIRPEGALGTLAGGEALVHISDITDTEDYRTGVWARWILADLGRARTAVWVALRKDDLLMGVIVLYRTEIRPFTDKEIALLQNFAAQAVIAMENARLLGEIRQRQQELRVTFDNMADGVVMFDVGLRLAAWNKNFQEIVDLPDKFLTDQHTYDEYIRYLARRGEFGAGTDAEATLARYRGHAGEHYTFERTRPDGKIIEVRHNPMPEGGFVLIYSDITDRKRSETEIRAARDAAEASLRDLTAAQARLIQAEKMASLGQLTAGIAHEIKNPLNFVNNFAALSVELLEELKEAAEPGIATLGQDKREEVEETIGMLTGNLEKITEHGRRADNIVKSMLEHSRGVSSERREVDLNAVVEEALNLAYHGARAQDQSFNITLEREFDGALKPIELAPQDMTRVLLNLFGNGFYAAAKRGRANGDAGFRPVLRVATHDLGDAVEITVRDNGTGIPPQIRDKLFQPFFTTKPTGEGTGLGLSISYDIVTQQHGGTIAVDSEEGAFTEFTIRLPRDRRPRPARGNA